ncbi:MAG: hypothetical protein NZ585_14525 [Chloracidobacterium sp.]|nr:hypothetical protein [Chloracidobacterium sp.]
MNLEIPSCWAQPENSISSTDDLSNTQRFDIQPRADKHGRGFASAAATPETGVASFFFGGHGNKFCCFFCFDCVESYIPRTISAHLKIF